MFNDKSILITGGTGSFGHQFIQTLLERYTPSRIVVFSRDELKQFEMQQRFPQPVMRFFIGDVRDGALKIDPIAKYLCSLYLSG